MDTRPRGVGIWYWLLACLAVGTVVWMVGVSMVGARPDPHASATHPLSHHEHGSPRCYDFGHSCSTMWKVSRGTYAIAGCDQVRDGIGFISQAVKVTGRSVYSRPGRAKDCNINRFHASHPPIKHRMIRHNPVSGRFWYSHWSYH